MADNENYVDPQEIHEDEVKHMGKGEEGEN